MSAIFILTPVIIGSWSMVVPLVTSAALAGGFHLMKQAVSQPKQVDTATTLIEMNQDECQFLAEGLKQEAEIHFSNGEVNLICRKDARGQFSICVQGVNQSESELRQIGEQMVGRIRQQYAYQKVMEGLSDQGYQLIEERLDGEKIKLRLRKFS